MCASRPGGRGSKRFCSHARGEGRCRGMTLIELVVFIVIVSVGVVGMLSVLNIAVFNSADPMVRKQLLSIAEALLEEVEMQPFTYCDQSDGNWATATAATTAGGCAVFESLGAEAGQQRVPPDPANRFNHVTDYHDLSLAPPISDINGNAATAPEGYSANITVVPEALGGIASADCGAANDCSAMNVVRIRVEVCRAAACPSVIGDSIVLEGYRARAWPNDLPW